jgi:hypothetical protein
LPTGDHGLLELSPSNAPVISTKSGLEGERRAEGAPPTTAKQESMRASTEKGSIGSKEEDLGEDLGEAQATAPLKKDAEVGDLEAEALRGGKGSNVAQGPWSMKAGTGEKADGPGRQKTPSPEVAEEETAKKGVLLVASQTEASTKTLDIKDSEGTTMKMGLAVTEVEQENV